MVDPIKTVFIWDECGQAPIRFFTLPGDYRRFMGIYINAYESNDNKRKHVEQTQKELAELIYDAEGRMKVAPMGGFPTHDVMTGAHVIVCGVIQ